MTYPHQHNLEEMQTFAAALYHMHRARITQLEPNQGTSADEAVCLEAGRTYAQLVQAMAAIRQAPAEKATPRSRSRSRLTRVPWGVTEISEAHNRGEHDDQRNSFCWACVYGPKDAPERLCGVCVLPMSECANPEQHGGPIVHKELEATK